MTRFMSSNSLIAYNYKLRHSSLRHSWVFLKPFVTVICNYLYSMNYENKNKHSGWRNLINTI